MRIGNAQLAAGWLLVALLLAAAFGLSQLPFGAGRYEVEVTQPFEGRLLIQPVPALAVPRPMESPGFSAYSVYPLTGAGLRGIQRNLQYFEDRPVTLNARVLCIGGMTVLEVDEGSIARVTREVQYPREFAIEDLEEVTLRGQIVDAKSYAGYQEPGMGDLLRSPASNAIRGGVPPVLVVKDPGGEERAFVLVDENGFGVGARVLGMVARPVEVRGKLKLWGGVPVLQADPASYRSLWFWE